VFFFFDFFRMDWRLLLLVLYVILFGYLKVRAYTVPFHWNGKENSAADEHWAMELAAGTDPLVIAERHGHELIGAIGELHGFYLFKKKPETLHGLTHPLHESSPEISWFARQQARPQFKRDGIPIDPLYDQQWHLHTVSGIDNVHVNVERVWTEKGIVGHGVNIALVDDGLEYSHADISPNYFASGSYDFNYGDPDPNPDNPNDDHGTSAAGVAAAANNSVCGVGSAFGAGLSGIRLISQATTDAQEASALTYRTDLNHIYSNSWGPPDDGRRLEGPERLASLGLETGVKQGRSGLGSVYVWAGGNGARSNDNCNYDGWANSRFTIAVGAIDFQGHQAWYSEPCSMLVVVAPSSSNTGRSITTTDLQGPRGFSSGDCTSTFGGTSAAAPLVAGIVALLLETRPDLRWRDIQALLLHSANRTHLLDSGWQINGAGLSFNHRYGFGLVDAYAAVLLAKAWTILPDEIVISSSANVQIPISEQNWVESSITIEPSSSMSVEHVEVVFRANHPRRGDLHIVLVSPFGTQSILAEAHGDTNANYDWKFGSIVNWGENSSGTWKLKVKDEINGLTGTFLSWQLNIYGH